MNLTIKSFQAKLAQQHPAVIAVYGALMAFGTYTCMYAFRRAFTVATFDNIAFAGVKLKILLVIAQLIGYTLSKFMGIRVISGMKHHNRAGAIIALILLSELALLLFALLPSPLNIVFMFLNGIPLGMVWGLVFSYVEGRKATEFMGSVLAVTFIFSSGFVKSTGKWLLTDYHISEFWMPVATGAFFIIPLLIFVFLLEQLPPPSAQDKALRTERAPMTSQERREFVMHFLPGIIVLVLTYVMLSVIRDFRDSFMADIWKELGFDDITIFTATETPISIVVLVLLSGLMLIRNNFRALQVNHIVVLAGFALAGFATYGYNQNLISAKMWMILNGLGLYLGYIPFNVVFFERLIAAARKPANVGFLIYIADSFGYLGSILVLLFKNFSHAEMSYGNFFISALNIAALAGIVLTGFSLFYFSNKISKEHHE